MPFPVQRPRRLRRGEVLRSMVAETRLTKEQLVLPLFITAGRDLQQPISSMPGHDRWSLDRLPAEIDAIAQLGLPAVLLFGLPATKDTEASGAWDEHGIVQEATRLFKARAPQILVIADTCLCEYTSHGHCGRLTAAGEVDNDATLELLAKTAVSQAAAGADIIAPSDMMDGRVAAIRGALDGAGFSQLPIMSYAAKYASAFYGPFREAADSAPAFGDRRGYQMDPANRREALREVRLDIEEGADIILIKPGMPYLDVIREVRDAIDLPLAAYQVSGEFAMIKAAVANGWLDERRTVIESVTALARAGSDIVITYFAKDLARWWGWG
jgi:porphobilinogen synthase